MYELVYVYVGLGGAPQFCGRLWARARKGQESASFEYDEGWLRAANRFSLEPALSLGPGSFHTGQGKALFGAIGDSAPDRWGRMLVWRAERRAAKRAKRTARTLRGIEYVLMDDEAGQRAALRSSYQRSRAFLRPR